MWLRNLPTVTDRYMAGDREEPARQAQEAPPHAVQIRLDARQRGRSDGRHVIVGAPLRRCGPGDRGCLREARGEACGRARDGGGAATDRHHRLQHLDHPDWGHRRRRHAMTAGRSRRNTPREVPFPFPFPLPSHSRSRYRAARRVHARVRVASTATYCDSRSRAVRRTNTRARPPAPAGVPCAACLSARRH